MKIRSTVFWPEKGFAANDRTDAPEDIAKQRIAAGLAVALAEGDPSETDAALILPWPADDVQAAAPAKPSATKPAKL